MAEGNVKDFSLRPAAVNIAKSALARGRSSYYNFGSYNASKVVFHAAVMKWSLAWKDYDLFKQAIDSALSAGGVGAHVIVDALRKVINISEQDNPDWQELE
jgi:hypothetical protein